MPQSMSEVKQFRKTLPVAQTIMAVLFGGWGLWQRNEFLSHSGLGWNSTLQFHVWPWPFKFAAVANMPAFLAGALLTWPIGSMWPRLSESAQLAPSLLFVAMLWYWIGAWLDNLCSISSMADKFAARVWISILFFLGLCAVLAYIPTSYTSYLPYGVMLWAIIGVVIVASRYALARKHSS